MRKSFIFWLSLLMLFILAVPVSAAEGFIYCEAQNLITEELNDQHLTLGELSRETGIQLELYFVTYSDEGIPMSSLGEVLYNNKEQPPEEYVSILIQLGEDADGWHLNETYPWDLLAKGSISENQSFLNSLRTVMDTLITQENWSGGLEEDQMAATLTAAAMVETVNHLYAEPSNPETRYVLDDAGLLTPEQQQALNAESKRIAETYGVGIYIMTVDDFRDYGEESQIFDVLWNYYHENAMGYGEDRQGMVLMLSMRYRDFATYFYGEDTEYAFNSYGQEQLEQYFLDNFGENDWYGGFCDYLEASEEFLQKAAAGDPMRESPAPMAMLFVVIALSISGLVTFVFWSQMRTAKLQSNASHYIKGGLQLNHKTDRFTHQTRSVRVIPKSSGSSGSRSHSGGGGSGRSGKF